MINLTSGGVAKCVQRTSTFTSGISATYAVTGMYTFGSVTGSTFVEDTSIARLSFALNSASITASIDTPTVQSQKFASLYNLLAPGIVPTPTDSTTSNSVPSKGEGDFKIADLDAVALTIIPALAGTIY